MVPPPPRANTPFPRKPSPTTLCSKGGVWCGGKIPTAVLAHQCSIGLKPKCRNCGATYKPPLPPSQEAFGPFGSARRDVAGKGLTGTKPKTETEKENERLRDLLKTHGVKDPQESSKMEDADKEIEKLQKGIQKLREVGLDTKFLEDQLAEKERNGKGQTASKPRVHAKLRAAQNTLKQVLENHESLHNALRENFTKGAKQAHLVQELQKQYDEILAKEGYTKPQEGGVDKALLIQMPPDLDAEQQAQWNTLVEGEADERKKQQAQKDEEFKKKLATMAENFAKQCELKKSEQAANTATPIGFEPPKEGAVDPPDSGGAKASTDKDESMLAVEGQTQCADDLELDKQLAEEISKMDESDASGKRAAQEGAEIFQNLAKAQRKTKQDK